MMNKRGTLPYSYPHEFLNLDAKCLRSWLQNIYEELSIQFIQLTSHERHTASHRTK